MYVCPLKAYLHACNMHMRMNIPILAHVLTCIPAHMHACMHACMDTCRRTDLLVWLLAHMQACVHNYTHICTYVDLCAYLVCVGEYCKMNGACSFMQHMQCLMGSQAVSGSECRILKSHQASSPLVVRVSLAASSAAVPER